MASSDSQNNEVGPVATAAAGESTGAPPTPPTVIAPSSPKPLPVMATESNEEGRGLRQENAFDSKSQLRKMSVPDTMKELPRITPEQALPGKEYGGLMSGGSKEAEKTETGETTAAKNDASAVLSAQLASLSVGPVNPDLFTPEMDLEKAAREKRTVKEETAEKNDMKGQSNQKRQPASPPPPPPPPKDLAYLDPTPMTPLPSAPSSVAGTPPKSSQLEPGFQESNASSNGHSKNDPSDEEDGQSEINSILEQFEPGHEGHETKEPSSHYSNPISPAVMSRSSSYNVLGGQHPPRTSSLDALKDMSSQSMSRTQSTSPTHPMSRTSPSSSFQGNGKVSPRTSNPTLDKSLPATEEVPPPPPPRPGKERKPSPQPSQQTLHKPPPPELDPDLPFDFQRFLDQLRHRTADPVAKYLRSFLQEFSKRQWMVHEQVKIIHDFLYFIVGKMAQCEVWREVSEQEFDNAKEGMEKLVMNRLYTQTFSPAISPPPPGTPVGSRRRGYRDTIGRRGQHQEDVERDEVLAQKVRIYGWVREEHLDIPPIGESGRKFLTLAQQELEKIKTYRAPRDKVICVLNCCKVIFGLLRHTASGDESADRFIPLLIYVVLRANPDHLVSNVQYILRFRNPEKLNGEAGYYLSSLMGAIQFIESLDRSSLTITDEEFERNVEAAVAAIAEKPAPSPPAPEEQEQIARQSRRLVAQGLDGSGEGSSGRLRSISPRPIVDKEPAVGHSYNHNHNNNNNNKYDNYGSSSNSDPDDAVAGLLRAVQKPLSTIGRIFGEATSAATGSGYSEGPVETPVTGNTPRRSPVPQQAPKGGHKGRGGRYSAEESAARQASAEAAEALRIQRAEHENVVGILADMFPGLDRDIISDVVVQKEGNVGLALDACLALS